MVDNVMDKFSLDSSCTDTKVTEKYLAQFPVTLRRCLENNDERRDFEKEIFTEYKDVPVYRAVKNPDEISGADFLGNAEKYDLDGTKYSARWARNHKNHSVSVNENADELIITTKFPNSHIKGIAKGYMRCQYGPADFKQGKTHHNWYLFKGKNETVCKEFAIDTEITKRAAEEKTAK